MSDTTVILSFFQGSITNRAKVADVAQRGDEGASSAAVETDADPSALHVSRELWDSEELRALRLFCSQARAYVKQHSRPSHFRSGLYAVKLEHIEEVQAHLEAQLPKLHELAEAFIDAMPRRQQEAKEKQGTLYREEDYPTAAQVRSAVRWEWRVLTLDAPTSLKQLGAHFYEKEQRKAQQQMERIVEEARSAIRAETLTLVEDLMGRLKPGDDGKVKTFTAGTMKTVQSWFELLRYRDADDPELKPIQDRLQAALDGIDPKDVRQDADYRNALAGTFDRLREQLGTLVVNKPKRSIDLGSLEPETAPAS